MGLHTINEIGRVSGRFPSYSVTGSTGRVGDLIIGCWTQNNIEFD